MNSKQMSVVGAAALALAIGAFYLGRGTATRGESVQPAQTTASAPGASGERRILYWHDPMVPGQRFDKPGKSPFMDMQLVPVYADQAGDAGVRIDPTVRQNLGLRTATVRKAVVGSVVDAVGTVQFDERQAVAVQTRVVGYVERLWVRATMESVRKGQPLATIYAPEWLGPLNELGALARAGAAPELMDAARERMRALSIPQELVQQAEERGASQARFTLAAPSSGVVVELGVREGAAVTPGTTLFRIAGLETVWAVAEIPEAQAMRIARGQKVSAVPQADASQAFSGELKELLPQISAATRTLQARFEVNNSAGKLIPGMLLRLQLLTPAVERLLVPAEAVIRTGSRAVVIVRDAGGGFAPREVALGADLGESLEILQGLVEGELVVTSGQFLVDSEARLRSALGAMAASAASVPAPGRAAAGGASAARTRAPATYAAQGTVESIDAQGITISHGPVPALRWPAMTMGFGKPDAKAFAGVKPGDSVDFEFREGGAIGYELVTIRRLGAGK